MSVSYAYDAYAYAYAHVKATHRSSTSAAQHKTQANVRQTDEKMEEAR